MALDDYVEPETALFMTAAAVVFSPRVRQVLHRGAVYGIAGVLGILDVASAFGRGIRNGMSSVNAETPGVEHAPPTTTS